MPKAIKLANWKKSALGSAIELHASESLEALRTKKPILLMGGVHGDEPEGIRLANDTLKWLYEASANKITLCPWILIPCLNVDGAAKEQRGNGRGVDLNRNYPSKNWSPEAKTERYQPGPSPASEPEVQAIVELIQNFHPRLIIHCHSWQPCIVGSGAPSKTDALRLGESSGYKVVDDIGYPTPGSLSAYGWNDLQIPVICIEENDQLPPNEYDSIWPRFQHGIQNVFTDLGERK